MELPNTVINRAVVAEWLRRLTRNQLGSARAGSNPADCEFLFVFCNAVCCVPVASVNLINKS